MSTTKEARSPMGYRFRLLHLRIASYRRTVHIHRRPDVHSLELQEEHPAAVFSVYGYFLTVPRFSRASNVHPYWYSGRCPAHCSNGESLPSAIRYRRTKAKPWPRPALDPALFRDSLPPRSTSQARPAPVRPCTSVGETHIAGRGLERQIQISSRHRLGVPHRSGMPHSREVTPLYEAHRAFCLPKRVCQLLPSADTSNLTSANLVGPCRTTISRKTGGRLCLSPQSKYLLPGHSPASIPSGRRRREPQKRPFRQEIPAHPSPN